jgi:hypothetical protein
MDAPAVRFGHLRTLLSPLFPVSPPSVRSRRLLVAGYVAAAVAGMAVLLERPSGVPTTNTIWAEDGHIYYQDAVNLPFLQTLTKSYAGYVQIFPRLAIQLTRHLPLRDVAPAIALLGAGATTGLALLVFHAARGHVRAPVLRAVLVAAVFLLPLAPGELIDNLVNVIWWLMFASFWMLLWRPPTWGGKIIATAVCFLATGSEPLVGLLLPLVVARVVVLRRGRDQLVTLGFVSGLAVQFVVRLSSVQPAFGHAPLPSLVKQFGIRVGFGWFGGRRLTDDLTMHHADLTAVIGLLVLAVLLVVALRWGDRATALLATVGAILVGLLFLVPVYLRWTAAMVVPYPAVEAGSRFAAVPILIIVSVLVIGVDRATRGLRSRRGLAIVLLVALLPAWVLDFRFANGRSDGPEWSAQVARAPAACRSAHGSDVTLQISPPGTAWTVQVPCRLAN